MAKSQDEIVTEYGLLAEAARIPDDFSWVDVPPAQGSALA
jgi:hypothetical protein